ncbi:MAG: hypothetical protein PHS80_02975 [Methanothrix sp.]|nr:hypothetical protein [Methanothrix sp.]MDD4447010.1 hypothetical protein [Methanothrix sp.]
MAIQPALADIAASPDSPARRRQPQARPRRCDGLTGAAAGGLASIGRLETDLDSAKKVSVSLRLCGLVCNCLNIIID